MDTETREEFSKVNKTLEKITLSVEKGLSYQKGLQLPERMKESEDKIEELSKTKASWNGLYLAVGIVLAIVGTVLAVVNAIQPK